MGTPTPTLSGVTAAIKVEMDAITPSIGTVFDQEHNLEDEVEQIVANQSGSGTADDWYIDLRAQTAVEGPANGENYRVWNIGIRYVSVRVGDADWLKTARLRVSQVVDKLTKNDAVFAINSQPQLRTPELVSVIAFGKVVGGGPVYEGNQWVEGELSLDVEARDF